MKSRVHGNLVSLIRNWTSVGQILAHSYFCGGRSFERADYLRLRIKTSPPRQLFGRPHNTVKVRYDPLAPQSTCRILRTLHSSFLRPP